MIDITAGEAWAKELLIRGLIEDESAFTIKMETHVLVVGFSKGDWTISKQTKTGEPLDYIQFSDAPGLNYSKSEIAKGVLEALCDVILAENHKNGDFHHRKTPSRILYKFLTLWTRIQKEDATIEVLQQGRNSFVDEDGKISLNP